MENKNSTLATLAELAGAWEIFESEVPGLVSGTEGFEFQADGAVVAWIVSDASGTSRFRVRLVPQADGFDVVFPSGKIYARWAFTWKGEYVELSHNLHAYRSLLRRVADG